MPSLYDLLMEQGQDTDRTLRMDSRGPNMKEEMQEDLAQLWESQWQSFLNTFESSSSRPGVPAEPASWDDTQAFLASFEQVAEACQWPKEEWVTRLLPALRGEARPVFNRLEPQDRGDYGKVKEAILQGDALRRERNRQHFRLFRYQEAEGPRGAYSKLQELCEGWLKAERHTKEEILELLILEQFLAVLPTEMQSWVKGHNLESSAHAVFLAEEFLLRQQVPCAGEGQVPLAQEEGPSSTSEAKETSADATVLLALSRTFQGQQKREGMIAKVSDQEKVSGGREENHQHERDMQTGVQRKPLEKTNINSLSFNYEGESSGNWPSDKSHQAVCPKEFGQKSILCEEIDLKPKMIMFHQEALKKKRRNMCTICGKTFSRNANLIWHRRIHTGEKPYKCSLCGKRFICSAYLRKHMQSHSTERPHVCLECGKGFRDKAHLMRHQETHMDGILFPCPCCGEAFTSKESLAMHSRIHTAEELSSNFAEITRYICCDCGKSFARKADYNKHQRIHTGEKPYKCPDCGKNFMWSSSWKRHRSTHVEEKGTPFLCQKDPAVEKNHICSKCGKNFPELWRLRSHELIHTGKRPYACTECGESFRWVSSLDGHIRRNHSEKEIAPLVQGTSDKPRRLHVCSVCGKAFTRAYVLRRHQRVHTGEKSYKCSECDMCFKWDSSLIQHMRNHRANKLGPSLQKMSDNQRKSYKCSTCGKRFQREAHVLRHQRIHTGERPYVCTDCGESFRWSSSLDRHRKKVHRGRKLIPLLQKLPSVPPISIAQSEPLTSHRDEEDACLSPSEGN